jgi:hypothetical protein
MFLDRHFLQARWPTTLNAFVDSFVLKDNVLRPALLGLHEQCATWNLEGRKLNMCIRTLIRETYWKQAASNIQ